jgi:O-antigen ligase
VWLIGRFMAGQLIRPSVAVRLLYCLVAWAFMGAALAWFQTEALIAVTKLFAGVLMLAVLEQLLPGHPERVKQLLMTVLASAVVPVGVALVQGVTGTGSLDTPGFNRVYGTSVHPVSLATYLIIVLIVAVGLVGQRNHRRALLVLIGASAVALFWTYTRSAWLIAALGLLLVLFRVRRVLVVPAIIALIAVPFLRPDIAARFADLSNRQSALTDDAANSLVWRFGYWEDVLAVSSDYRLTGVGLDTVSMWTSLGLQPHNIFVQAYVELGVIGLLLLTAAFGAIGLQFRRRRRSATTSLERLTANIAGIVALCIFIQALTTNPLAGTVTWWYLAAACTFGFVDTPARTPGEPDSRGPGRALEHGRLTRTARTRMG